MNLFFWKGPKAGPHAPTSGRAQRPPLAPAIFLDFDGVLHPHQRGTLERLPLVEAFLRAHPHVQVVVTSTGRMQYSLEDLRELFAEDVRNQIEGVTPFSSRTPFSRYLEIQEYLETTGMRKWCALDDEERLFPPECPNFVPTRAERGLTPESLLQAAQILAL